MSDSSSKSPARLIPILWSDGTIANDPTPAPPELPPVAGIGLSAAMSALLSGMHGMVNTARDNFDPLIKGDMDGVEYAGQLVKSGTDKATQGGLKAAAAFTLQEGLKIVSNKVGKEVFKKIARSNVVTMIAFGVVDQSVDSYKYYNKQIDLREYKINSMQNVGSAGGSIAGGAMGAVIGSVVPGLGTLMGGFIGSMLGASSGAAAGKNWGEELFQTETPSSKS